MIAPPRNEARATLVEMLIGIASATPRRGGGVPRGVELSVLALCDGVAGASTGAGARFASASARANTPKRGGMGTFSPVDGVDAALVEEVRSGSASRSSTSSPAAGRRPTACWRGPDADHGRTEGDRVQRSLRRPETPGRSSAVPDPDLLDLLQRAVTPRATRGRDTRVGRARRGDRALLTSRGYPPELLRRRGSARLEAARRRRGDPRRHRAAGPRRRRHRRRARAQRHRARRGPRGRPPGHVCCRRPDHVRRKNLRRTSPYERSGTETEVETELDRLPSTPRTSASSSTPGPTCPRSRRPPRS